MGFNKTGYWTVETRESGKAGKAIKGFLTREEAISHAETMKNEWCPIYLLAQKLRQNNGLTNTQNKSTIQDDPIIRAV